MKDNASTKPDTTFDNNILVLGNGFDLSRGYKTKYKDFISFIKENGYKKFRIDSQQFEEIKNNNHFIKYLCDKDFELWSDVETEMHRIISSIQEVYNKQVEKEFKYYPRYRNHKGAIEIETDNEFTKYVLSIFDLSEEYSRKILYPEKYVDYINGIKWDKLNDFLLKELDDFKKELFFYLRNYVPLIQEKNSKKTSEKNSDIKDIKPDHIITFNYTDFYKQDFPDCSDVIYVHGNLNDGTIVLGYEDDSSDENEYIQFKKYFQRLKYQLKPISREDEMFNKNDIFLEGLDIEEKMKNNIYFYGLSFDITDEDYIKELFSVNNATFFIYYLDSADYEHKTINLIRILGKKELLEKIYKKEIQFIKIDEKSRKSFTN